MAQASTNTSLEDLYRPATLAELAAQAQDFTWDPSKPANYWLDFVHEGLRTSDAYEAMDEIELAYIERARAVSISLERLPFLENRLPSEVWAQLETETPNMLQDLDRLEGVLRARREEWEARREPQVRTPSPPPRIPVHENWCECGQCTGLLADSPESSGGAPTYLARNDNDDDDDDGFDGASSPLRRPPSSSAWEDQDGGGDDDWDEEVIARVMRQSMLQVDDESGSTSNGPSPNGGFKVSLGQPAYGPFTQAGGSSEKTPASSRGLCVVCQDEEANMAVVDCGHLAMCRGCCSQIMEDTKECPLCRTHIASESRLLRIFKT